MTKLGVEFWIVQHYIGSSERVSRGMVTRKLFPPNNPSNVVSPSNNPSNFVSSSDNRSNFVSPSDNRSNFVSPSDNRTNGSGPPVDRCCENDVLKSYLTTQKYELLSDNLKENPLPVDQRSVREVLNSYMIQKSNMIKKSNISCTKCEVVGPEVHLNVDVEENEGFIIDDVALAGSLVDFPKKFRENHPSRNKVFFILNIFIKGCLSNVDLTTCFHVQIHVLLHVFDTSGNDYQLETKMIEYKDLKIDDSFQDTTNVVIDNCIDTAINEASGRNLQLQLKSRLTPLEIAPTYEDLPGIKKEIETQPVNLLEVPMPRYHDYLKASYGSYKHVIMLLNAVVVKQA